MMRKILLVTAAVFLAAGCGYGGNGTGDGGNGDGGNGGEYYVRAEVSITTPMSGSGFHFDEPCIVSSSEIDQVMYWGLEAKDLEEPFGIVITWKESYVTGPGTFQANEGLGDLSTMIVRAHPTEPDQIRMSGVGEGTVTFSQVGYQSGDLISGSFDGLRMDRTDPDDTIHVEMDNGTFHCRAQ